MVEMLLLRIALSQREPTPSADRLALLTADALRLWADIPTGDLIEAVDEALRDAGNFPLKAGNVPKVWFGSEGKRVLELASPRSDSTIDAVKAEQERWDALTPEERSIEQAEWRLFWQEQRAKVGGIAA